MGNCLKTQLKEVVQNNELQKLGVLRIKRVSEAIDTEAHAFIVIGAKEGDTITLDNGGFLKRTFSGASIGNTYTFASDGSQSFYTSNGDYNIEIKSKYNAYIANAGECNVVDIADVYYTKNTIIQGYGWTGELSKANIAQTKTLSLLHNSRVTGTIDDIAKMTELTTLDVRGVEGKIDGGNIEKLCTLIKLTGSIGFPYRGMTGTIEGWIAGMIAISPSTKQSGTLTLLTLNDSNGKITFRDTIIEAIASRALSWEQSDNNTVISLTGFEPTTIHVNADGTWTRVS